MVQPFTQTVGLTLVDLGKCYVDIKALVDFIGLLGGCENDAYSQDVVNLVEGDMLGLHLVPDRVGCFHTLDDAVLEPHLIQGVLNGGDKIGKELITLSCRLGQLRLDSGIFFRMFKTEREILQFRFYLVKSQSVGKRCIDIECFTCNLILFVGRL